MGTAVLAGVVTVDGEALSHVGWFAFAAAVYGGSMWLLFYRRYVRDVIAGPADAPATAQRETVRRTIRRHAPFLVGLGAVLGVAAVLVGPDGGDMFAGMATGNAVSLLWLARRFDRYERETRCVFLREPRSRSWRGRGLLTASDYYRADEPTE